MMENMDFWLCIFAELNETKQTTDIASGRVCTRTIYNVFHHPSHKMYTTELEHI